MVNIVLHIPFQHMISLIRSLGLSSTGYSANGYFGREPQGWKRHHIMVRVATSAVIYAWRPHMYNKRYQEVQSALIYFISYTQLAARDLQSLILHTRLCASHCQYWTSVRVIFSITKPGNRLFRYLWNLIPATLYKSFCS